MPLLTFEAIFHTGACAYDRQVDRALDGSDAALADQWKVRDAGIAGLPVSEQITGKLTYHRTPKEQLVFLQPNLFSSPGRVKAP